MDIITARLIGLEKLELKLNADWASTVQLRKQYDLKLSEKRAAENERWKKRFFERDNEEDELRQRKRQLERRISSAGHILMESEASTKAADMSMLTEYERQVSHTSQTPTSELNKITNSINLITESSSLIELNSKPHKKLRAPTKSRYQPIKHDDKGRPWYLRSWDGKLVYLECCVEGCKKDDFKSVRAAFCHVNWGTGGAHGLKGLVNDYYDVLEKCGKGAKDVENAPS